MNTDDFLHALREQRLTTLALADQIKEDRWREPLLPGDRSLHDLLAHMLAWDEWAVGVFEISRLRTLPPVLIDALRDVDAYNARAMRRYAKITRDDMLSALQASPDRVLASAIGPGGEHWLDRRFPELAHARTLDANKEESVITSRGQVSAGCCACCCTTRSAIIRKSPRHSRSSRIWSSFAIAHPRRESPSNSLRATHERPTDHPNGSGFHPRVTRKEWTIDAGAEIT